MYSKDFKSICLKGAIYLGIRVEDMKSKLEWTAIHNHVQFRCNKACRYNLLVAVVSDLLDFIIHHQYKSCSTQLPKNMESQGWFARNFRKVWMWISPTPFQVDDEGVLFDKLPRARVRLPLVPQMLQFCQIFGEFLCGQKSPKNVDEIWSESFQKSPKWASFWRRSFEYIFHWWNSHTLWVCSNMMRKKQCILNFAKGCHVCRSFSSIIIVSVLIHMLIAHRHRPGPGKRDSEGT